MNIEFTVKGETYKIEPIKIKDYYSIRTALLLGGSEAEFEIVSALSGCPVETLKQVKVDQWGIISFNLNLIINRAFNQSDKMTFRFEMDGIEYGLADFDQMTIGEFGDLDVIVNSNNADDRLHEMLAILYRPIIGESHGKYKIGDYDYEGFKHRSEFFLNAPVELAKSVSGFFLHSAQASLKAMSISSDQKTKRIIKKTNQLLQTLQEDGGSLSSHSLDKILLTSQELQNLVSENPLTTLPGSMTKTAKQNWNIKKWFKNITA
jgi:hypothetical protein